MNDLLLRFMDNWNVLLVNELFMYHWLNMFCCNIPVMFMNNILMLLFNNILMVLNHYIFSLLSNHWLFDNFSNFGTLLMS